MNDDSTHDLRLRQLCFTAATAWAAGSSTDDYEDTFEAVLDYLIAYPSVEPHFVTLAIELLNQRDFGALDLLSFVLHTVRSPAVLAEVKRLEAKSEDPRAKTALMHIVDAYDDLWEDRVMYRRYSTIPRDGC